MVSITLFCQLESATCVSNAGELASNSLQLGLRSELVSCGWGCLCLSERGLGWSYEIHILTGPEEVHSMDFHLRLWLHEYHVTELCEREQTANLNKIRVAVRPSAQRIDQWLGHQCHGRLWPMPEQCHGIACILLVLDLFCYFVQV